jgi:hypothetical protein
MFGSGNTSGGYGSGMYTGWSNLGSYGYYGIVNGYRGLIARDNSWTYSSGYFAAQGDAQFSKMLRRVATTNATPALLVADGQTSAANTNIQSGSTVGFRGTVVARQSSGTNSSVWKIEGVIRNNAGTTALIGTPTVTLVAQDAGASAWAVAITANNTTDMLDVTVTGVAATNIRWVADIDFTECAY